MQDELNLGGACSLFDIWPTNHSSVASLTDAWQNTDGTLKTSKYNYENLFVIFFKPQITDGYFVCRIAFNCNNANISASRGLVGGDSGYLEVVFFK